MSIAGLSFANEWCTYSIVLDQRFMICTLDSSFWLSLSEIHWPIDLVDICMFVQREAHLESLSILDLKCIRFSIISNIAHCILGPCPGLHLKLDDKMHIWPMSLPIVTYIIFEVDVWIYSKFLLMIFDV